jgi:hypothetical protein
MSCDLVTFFRKRRDYVARREEAEDKILMEMRMCWMDRGRRDSET